MNERALKKTLASGSVDSVLEGIRISGLDLSGLHIRPSLARAYFSRVKLNNAFVSNINESDMYNCTCRGLRVYNLSRTSIVRSIFCNANFDMSMQNCRFEDTDMRLTRFAFPVTGMRSWSGNAFIDADLRGLDAAGCSMSDSRFVRCRLDGARLSRAKWSGVETDGCTFALVNAVRSVGIRDAAVRECNLRKHVFRRSLNLCEGLTASMAKKMEHAFAGDKDIGIRWNFVSRDGVCNRLFLWIDRSVLNNRGLAVGAEECGVFRTYEWSESKSLRSVFNDMVSDYWDWILVGDSIRVDGTRQRGCKIATMFADRLREHFVSV